MLISGARLALGVGQSKQSMLLTTQVDGAVGLLVIE